MGEGTGRRGPSARLMDELLPVRARPEQLVVRVRVLRQPRLQLAGRHDVIFPYPRAGRLGIPVESSLK